MIGMISFSVLNEKWTRKITNHYMEQEKIKKVRKSLVTSGFFKNPVISFSALRAIKTPDFTTKSGVFLTFWHKMVSVKMGLELVLELVAETLKTQNRENLTFLDFYFS